MQAGVRVSKGVRAAKQSRSKAKHQALLEAGRRLLDTHDLAALSVAQLTRDAGMQMVARSTRASRTRDAWFAELLRVTGEQALQDTQALLVGARFQRADDAHKVALIVRHIVAIHRAPRHLPRRALRFGALAAVLAAAACLRPAPGRRGVPGAGPAHAPGAGGTAQAARGHRLQLVFGTLVNAVLHNPGPIGLHDKRMETELSRVFLATVQLD